MGILLSWLVLTIAVWLTALILPGVHIKGFGSAILVAALFGVLNFLLGWLFFTVFAIATLGLAVLLAFITRWIINAIILKLVDAMSDSIKIDGFGWALVAALVMSAAGSLAEWGIRAVGIG
ncbi:phage holin family protein [Lujinxingia vulgaris]|uniref:Phage holin family protein n=1 Tax=Lujinxingia vulgaris TaxID=2600176 RepID=A0A5C6XAB6_9DELT|nr:phage holin family protein [Lujinxingia vulgaris]TXD38826.1 phage holin family protein [Lujinxingia vulgaris]